MMDNEKVEQLAANNLTIPQDAIASLLQRLVLSVLVGFLRILSVKASADTTDSKLLWLHTLSWPQ